MTSFLGRLPAAVAAMLLVVSGLSASLLVASPVAFATSTQVLGGTWQGDYYRNWFDSLATCTSRGNAMLNDPHLYNAGLRNYDCHKHAGEPKWSMDLYWLT